MSKAPAHIPKEYKLHIKNLEKLGWVVSRASIHTRITHPKYGSIFFSTTPSDKHSLDNFLADVRRRTRQYDNTG